MFPKLQVNRNLKKLNPSNLTFYFSKCYQLKRMIPIAIGQNFLTCNQKKKQGYESM